MKLSELFEHKEWYQSKSLEAALGVALEYTRNNEPLPADFDASVGKNKAGVLALAGTFDKFAGNGKVSIEGKPSTAGIKSAYGGGVEPKADLIVISGGKTYNISVKANDAYLFSAGSKTEYTGLIFASLQLYEKLYPAKAKLAIREIKSELLKLEKYVGANKKISDYSPNGLKKKLDGSWFSDPKYDKLKPAAAKKAKELELAARAIITKDNATHKGSYKELLKEAEGTVKTVLLDTFAANPEFAQCFFWEVSTGVFKFDALNDIASFKTAGPFANVIANIGKTWFDVSKVDSPYIKNAAKNHAVRLQNVPRGWLGTFQSFCNKNVNTTAQDLADCLREIEFSLKMAATNVSTIKEFAPAPINVKLVEAITKVSSLTELLLAFEIFPTIDV